MADDPFEREAQAAAQRVDAYMKTIERIEPDVTPIDDVAFYASAAISLKRIADALERKNEMLNEFFRAMVLEKK